MIKDIVKNTNGKILEIGRESHCYKIIGILDKLKTENFPIVVMMIYL